MTDLDHLIDDINDMVRQAVAEHLERVGIEGTEHASMVEQIAGSDLFMSLSPDQVNALAADKLKDLIMRQARQALGL
jgi:hypothetical protein